MYYIVFYLYCICKNLQVATSLVLFQVGINVNRILIIVMATKEPKDKKDLKETLNTDVKPPIKFKFVEGMLVLYSPSLVK